MTEPAPALLLEPAVEVATEAAPKPKKGEKGDKGEGRGRLPRGVRIHVRNLAPSITAAQLSELFAGCGSVIKAEVKLNDDETSRGFGFAILQSMPEATKAVAEINGKVVDGKAIEVQLAPEYPKDDAKGKGDKGKGKGKDGGCCKGKGKSQPMMPSPMEAMASYPPLRYPPMAYNFGYPAMPYGYPPMFGAPYGYPYPGMMPEYYQAVLPGGASPMHPMAHAMHPGTEAALPHGTGSIPMAHPGTEAALAGLSPATGMEPPLPSVQTETQSKKTKGKGKGKKGGGGAKEVSSPPDVPAPAPDRVFQGTLKSLSAKNGYGFIECEESYGMYQRDVYVDSDQVSENVKKGAPLQFNIVLSAKGRPQAANIMPMIVLGL